MIEPNLRQVGKTKKRRNSILETSKGISNKKMKCEVDENKEEVAMEVEGCTNKDEKSSMDTAEKEYDELKSNFSKITSNGFKKNGTTLSNGKPGYAKKLVIKNFSSLYIIFYGNFFYTEKCFQTKLKVHIPKPKLLLQ